MTRMGPRAGGEPLAEEVAREAAHWFSLCRSECMTDIQREAWQRWRAAHPDHERAWLHIEAVTARLTGLPASAAMTALQAGSQAGRRRFFKSMAILAMVGGGAAMVATRGDWRAWSADHATAVGERRAWHLPDGTTVLADTDSAFDVRLEPAWRTLVLHRGEILVTTGHDGPAADRPLRVLTPVGHARALGTRLAVRRLPGQARVSVFEGAVALAPRRDAEAGRVLHAGESATFGDDWVADGRAVGTSQPAWARGELAADDMALGDFLAELGRYRRGLLGCDPDVANLRLSGLFPLDDTDRVLQAVVSLLPVRLRTRTPYWVTVVPR